MLNWKNCGKVTIAMIPFAAAMVLVATSNPTVIRMQGPCDPATFNAAVGPGTCIGNGTITFDHFVKELTNSQKAGAWLFSPADGTLAPGTVLSLENRAGEVHTFTKVKEFWRRFCSVPQPVSWHSGPSAGMRPKYGRYARAPARKPQQHIRGGGKDRGRSHGW